MKNIKNSGSTSISNKDVAGSTKDEITAKEFDTTAYNIPDSYITICGKKLELKDMPFKHEKRVMLLLDETIKGITSESKEKFSASDLLLKIKESLLLVWSDKLPEIVKIISDSYDQNLDLDKITTEMTSSQMVEVVLIQLERNKRSSPVAYAFFIKAIKKLPTITDLITPQIMDLIKLSLMNSAYSNVCANDTVNFQTT